MPVHTRSQITKPAKRPADSLLDKRLRKIQKLQEGGLSPSLSKLTVRPVDTSTALSLLDGKDGKQPKGLAILVSSFEVGADKETTTSNAKQALQQALEGTLEHEDYRNRLIMGNKPGLAVAKLAVDEPVINRFFAVLNESYLKYLVVRKRFVGTYIQNRWLDPSFGIPQPNDSERRTISRLNEKVHGGDVLFDSLIWSSNKLQPRNDPPIYQSLYGITLEETAKLVPEIETAIKQINNHATIMADKEQNPTELFHQAFARFIQLLRESNFSPQVLKDEKSELHKAMIAFREAQRSAVVRTGRFYAKEGGSKTAAAHSGSDKQISSAEDSSAPRQAPAPGQAPLPGPRLMGQWQNPLQIGGTGGVQPAGGLQSGGQPRGGQQTGGGQPRGGQRRGRGQQRGGTGRGGRRPFS